MNSTPISRFSKADKKAAILCGLFVLILVSLTLVQDLVRSGLKNSAFYFSESFMFSSFWWFFAPLFFTQYFSIKQKNSSNLLFSSAVMILPIVLHLFAFPVLVWALSGIFYYHTFSIRQTLNYTVSEYLYLLIVLYTVPFLTYRYLAGKTTVAEKISGLQDEETASLFINSILVSEGYKKFNIAVSDIYCCTANPPYININLAGQKYLHNETLRSLLLKLDPDEFVRIHKSAIVNIKMVASYKTRLNGDYDLTLKNDVQLRVSRNFAADFKNLYNKTHPHTAK